MSLKVISAGPQVTVQDMGREGFISYGLSQGGAMDRAALWEGAALLGQSEQLAALEMAGFGGEFAAEADMTIALTGAPMRAELDGVPLRWNASHALPRGARLRIGAAEVGTYGYLHVAGGFDVPKQLGARAAHLVAGLGAALQAGDVLPVGVSSSVAGMGLNAVGRFGGGEIRLVPSVQTALFDAGELARFEGTSFKRDMRGNRMGARLEGGTFQSEAGLSVVSEIARPGDVQITGDGTPFVLMVECQTTGGYPRIGAVIPSDFARVAQARPGDALRFRFITLQEAVELERKDAARLAGLKPDPLVRDPRDVPNLLEYQLISGVVRG